MTWNVIRCIFAKPHDGIDSLQNLIVPLVLIQIVRDSHQFTGPIPNRLRKVFKRELITGSWLHVMLQELHVPSRTVYLTCHCFPYPTKGRRTKKWKMRNRRSILPPKE